MLQQLDHLIQQIQEHIDADVADGTLIPGRYQEIQSLLDQAKLSLATGDLEKTLDLIGEINLDALQEVDELDDTIGEVIQQLQHIQKKYLREGLSIPAEISRELQQLQAILQPYIVSQRCP